MPVTLTCAICRAPFVVTPKVAADGKRRFCSLLCYGVWLSTRSTPEERFWAKVEKRGPDECWLWTGSCGVNGYGVVWVNKGGQTTTDYAHRRSWAMANGPIPEGADILHGCEGRYPPGDSTCRRCVNPAHLRPGGQVENNQEAEALGRMRQGETHRSARLTAEQVRELVALHDRGESVRRLASRYGVSRGAVSDIVTGRTWKRTVRVAYARRPRTRLSPKQAREIVVLYQTGAVSQRRLAALFGITQGAVSHIVHGRSWKHLPRPEAPTDDE